MIARSLRFSIAGVVLAVTTSAWGQDDHSYSSYYDGAPTRSPAGELNFSPPPALTSDSVDNVDAPPTPPPPADLTETPADPCDCKRLQAVSKAVAGSHKPLYYNNNFDYLCDECYDQWHLGDSLKRMCWGDCLSADVGGSYRMRYHSEHNLRGKPLAGNDDDFLLQQTRLYVNAEYGGWLRFYGEMIDAASDGQNFSPRGTEVNRVDALDLFLDAKLLTGCRGELWGRVGRQELLYGVERLVSPLHWGNTRRTFDGAKLFWQGSSWDVDAFWTRPVPFGQHLPRDHNFDNPNEDQEFAGIYSSFKGTPGRTLDFYYLRLADYGGAAVNANGNAGDFDYNTFGLRVQGSRCDWLYDVEGGVQVGDFGPDRIEAGFFTAGLGRKFPCACWQPTVWLYYDWASGDGDPADAVDHTFNQLFPLGHKYFGFMDIIGRQNIEDLNVLATVQPCDNVKLVLWWHAFWLQQSRGALYDAGGAPIYHDPTGASGDDVGQEIDLLVDWQLTPRVNLWFGYSHFFAGSYFDSATIQSPAAAGLVAGNGATGMDADFFYTQMTVNF